MAASKWDPQTVWDRLPDPNRRMLCTDYIYPDLYFHEMRYPYGALVYLGLTGPILAVSNARIALTKRWPDCQWDPPTRDGRCVYTQQGKRYLPGTFANLATAGAGEAYGY